MDRKGIENVPTTKEPPKKNKDSTLGSRWYGWWEGKWWCHCVWRGRRRRKKKQKERTEEEKKRRTKIGKQRIEKQNRKQRSKIIINQ